MKPQWPRTSQKQLWCLLNALLAGEHHTVKSAMATMGIYALSQRCGNLKQLGWPIQSKMVPVSETTTVMEYWMER
jgi:hypothetical protein